MILTLGAGPCGVDNVLVGAPLVGALNEGYFICPEIEDLSD